MLAIVASLVATLVGGRFCLSLAQRWDAGGRASPALLHWTISTGMFALASAMLLAGEVFGWTSVTFRVFYAFGAVLNVPWLALGSVLVNVRTRAVTATSGFAAVVVGLLFLPAALSGSALAVPGAVLGLVWGALLLQRDPSIARRGSVGLMLAFGVVGVAAVFGTSIQGALPSDGIPEGRELFVDGVRGLAVGANALGATIVILGALASALAMSWEHTSQRARADFREMLRRAPVQAVAEVLFAGNRAAREAGVAHLAGGNLLIALGVLVAAGSGGMFSFLGDTAGHAIGLGGGAAIMYAGFVRTIRTRAAGIDVVVYTRRGCGLCRTAEELVAREAAGASIRHVDVDSSPELQEQYGVRVPVVTVDGREVAELEVASGTVRRALRAAASTVAGQR